MKEITRNDAMAGTWKALGTQNRLELLHLVGVNKSWLTGGVDLYSCSAQEDFSQLPIPVRTLLDNYFDGEEGQFSTAYHERKQAWLQREMESFDRVERAIQ